MNSLLKTHLQVAAMMLLNTGQIVSGYAGISHGDETNFKQFHTGRVNFEDSECQHPNSLHMNETTALICINTCNATSISFVAAYFVKSKLYYVRLEIEVNQPDLVPVTLKFIDTESGIFLSATLSSQTHSNRAEKPEGDLNFRDFSAKSGPRNLPFKNIENSGQCESLATTTTTTTSRSFSSPAHMSQTVLAAVTGSPRSAEEEDFAKTDSDSVYKVAPVAGGVAGALLLLAVLVAAVLWLRRRRSRGKREDAPPAGGTHRCSMNSLYDSSHFPAPLTRHESNNSLYEASTGHGGAGKFNHGLKTVTFSEASPGFSAQLPRVGQGSHETINSLYHNTGTDGPQRSYAGSNIYDPV